MAFVLLAFEGCRLSNIGGKLTFPVSITPRIGMKFSDNRVMRHRAPYRFPAVAVSIPRWDAGFPIISVSDHGLDADLHPINAGLRWPDVSNDPIDVSVVIGDASAHSSVAFRSKRTLYPNFFPGGGL